MHGNLLRSMVSPCRLPAAMASRIPLQPAWAGSEHMRVSHTSLTTGSKPAHICKTPKRTSHSQRSVTRRVQQLTWVCYQSSPLLQSYSLHQQCPSNENGDSRDRRCTAILDPDAGLKSPFSELRYYVPHHCVPENVLLLPKQGLYTEWILSGQWAG